jgi:archaellum component FlaC
MPFDNRDVNAGIDNPAAEAANETLDTLGDLSTKIDNAYGKLRRLIEAGEVADASEWADVLPDLADAVRRLEALA